LIFWKGTPLGKAAKYESMVEVGGVGEDGFFAAAIDTRQSASSNTENTSKPPFIPEKIFFCIFSTSF